MTETSTRPLTLNEAADYMQVHRKTLLKALQRGECVGYQRGANCLWRIYQDDLDRYIKSSKPGRPTPKVGRSPVPASASERPRTSSR